MANFTGTSGNDTITPTSISDGVTVSPPNSNLDGDDTINAGLGSDNVDGGEGNDLLIVDYSSNTYTGSNSGIISLLSVWENSGYF